MKYLILIFLIFNSCTFSKKEDKKYGKEYLSNNEVRTKCSSHKLFLKSKNLSSAINKKMDTIPFSLIYDQEVCYRKNGIFFNKLDFSISPNSQRELSFYLGLKNDSLFTADIEKQKLETISFLFSFKDSIYPRRLNNMFFLPERLTIDSIYYKKNDKIFVIDSFYDMPHGTPPKYTFDKFYISNKRGFFRVDILNNDTKEIYTSIALANNIGG